jgi:hypothetical protein
MNCKTCNKIIEKDWRKDKQTIKTKPLIYCSRNCSNSRGKRSEEVKIKISNKLTGLKRNSTKTYNDYMCLVCGDVYTTQAGYERKACSRVCANYLLSVARQNYLKEHGNFSTKRESFTYKNLTIEVDSNLEKAGIVYLIDVLKATNIERFNNILNYWEGVAHKTFNPDFICTVDDKTHIIEVKQKWIKTSDHPYNKNIPLKYEALKKFCEEKNYNMLWIDFETTPELKKIYKEILSSRTLGSNNNI